MKKLISKNTRNRDAHKQSGFSLIEVMIAALVLSIGILGVASLQIIGMKGTQQSHMKQQAVGIIYALTERMRSNRQGVIAGGYLLDSDHPVNCNVEPNCTTADCSTSDIATFDLHNIVCGYKSGGASYRTGGIVAANVNDIVILSDGDLEVNYPNGAASGDVRIKVQWRERRFGQEHSEEELEKSSLVINTRILP